MDDADGDMDDMDDADDADGDMAVEFTVRVENVSTGETLDTSEGSAGVPLSPVAYAVYSEEAAAFEPGEAASTGLERLAEDGSPGDLAGELETEAVHAGTEAVPVDGDEPAPIGPGGAYEFTVESTDGDDRLSLATMFVESNDLFYAPGTDGIPLYEMGEPVSGSATGHLRLWDAGTEANEEPGVGENQAPRQADADTGPEEDAVVRPIEDVDDGHDYPDTVDVVELTIGHGGMDG